MSTIRALLVVIAVLATAISGFAAEIGRVVGIHYGYDPVDKSSTIDTSLVDTAFYADGTADCLIL